MGPEPDEGRWKRPKNNCESEHAFNYEIPFPFPTAFVPRNKTVERRFEKPNVMGVFVFVKILYGIIFGKFVGLRKSKRGNGESCRR